MSTSFTYTIGDKILAYDLPQKPRFYGEGIITGTGDSPSGKKAYIIQTTKIVRNNLERPIEPNFEVHYIPLEIPEDDSYTYYSRIQLLDKAAKD